MDTVGAAYMTIDNGKYGCEGNHRRAWEYLAKHNTSEWSIVLEDDAIPVPEGFNEQLAQVLDNAPTPIVSLYLGKLRPPHWQSAIRQAVEQATTQDSHYLVGTHLLHAVAVAIRTDLLADMLTSTATTQHAWDFRIAAWALERGHAVSYTFPSLVDHADGDTVVKHPDGKTRTPGRVAWHTGTQGIRTTWDTTRTTPINP